MTTLTLTLCKLRFGGEAFYTALLGIHSLGADVEAAMLEDGHIKFRYNYGRWSSSMYALPNIPETTTLMEIFEPLLDSLLELAQHRSLALYKALSDSLKLIVLA